MQLDWLYVQGGLGLTFTIWDEHFVISGFVQNNALAWCILKTLQVGSCITYSEANLESLMFFSRKLYIYSSSSVYLASHHLAKPTYKHL